MASRQVGLPQARETPVSERVALCLPSSEVVVAWFVTGVFANSTGLQVMWPVFAVG
jgi:hypothetical protein